MKPTFLSAEMHCKMSNLSCINKARRDIALSCSIGSRPWSSSNNCRLWLSEDQSKHYLYRANQQVGLARLWSKDWALLLLIHSSESIYRLWISNHVPVQCHSIVIVQCFCSLIAMCECFNWPTRPNRFPADASDGCSSIEPVEVH